MKGDRGLISSEVGRRPGCKNALILLESQSLIGRANEPARAFEQRQQAGDVAVGYVESVDDFQRAIEQRITDLEQLKDELDGCIGCGCLSLRSCALFNAGDKAAVRGPGARYLLGDRPGTDSR